METPEPPPSETAPAEVGWRPRQLLVLAGVRVRNIGTYIDDSSGRVHFFAADAFPEIDLELSYRPWYDKPDEVRGVFFGIQGSFSVGMAYIATPSNEQRGMTSLRFRLDAGYAHVLGDVVELAGMIGFGVEGVQLDQPEGFPSTLYSFLRPAIGVRVRAVPTSSSSRRASAGASASTAARSRRRTGRASSSAAWTSTPGSPGAWSRASRGPRASATPTTR
ncbi:MAG: hypothetical protein M5U28_20730 [Sandaracinaceae bacterium]|nr:hypothetical protein [Sandaracinaceae bacterium]